MSGKYDPHLKKLVLESIDIRNELEGALSALQDLSDKLDVLQEISSKLDTLISLEQVRLSAQLQQRCQKE